MAQGLPSWGASALRCLGGDSRAFVTLQENAGRDPGPLLVHRQGGRVEQCLDVPDGRIALDPVPNARPPPADTAAFFVAHPCAAARRAEDREGQPIGWFATPSCR